MSKRPFLVLVLISLFAFTAVPAAIQSVPSDSDPVFTSVPTVADGRFFGPAESLAGFDYRKLHTVNGSVGAGTAYQVRITTHYGSGTDSGEHVYLNGLCQPDFDDIRFVDDDGQTQLAYWMESRSIGVVAAFWVKVLDDLSQDQAFYIYFGDLSAMTTSNGDATFIFFDDFEDQDFEEWDIAGASFEVVDDIVSQGNCAAYCAGGAADRTLNESFTGLDHGFLLHVDARVASSSAGAGYMCWGVGTKDAGGIRGFYCLSFRDGNIQYYIGTYYPWPQNSAYGVNQWYELELGMDPVTDKRRAWKNGTYMGELDLLAVDGTSTFADITQLRLSAGTNPGQDVWIDEYYIRKWVPNEPQHGEWGAAESLTESLDFFDYRKLHTINGSLGAGTGYQVRITTHYGNGTDSGEDVYLDGLCQPDFDDIRFTDATGSALLAHWREDYTESQNATFWVEIQENLNATCSIYVYFGNPTASSRSNGHATFLFFDDFEDGTLGNWDLIGNNWNVQGTVVKNGDSSACGIADPDGRLLEKAFVTSDSYLVHAWIRESDVVDNNVFYYGVSMDQSDRHVYSVAALYGSLQHYENETWSSWPENSAVTSNTWYRMEFALDLNNHEQYAWKDRLSMGSVHLYNEDGNESSSISKLRVGTYWTAGDTGWVDDYYARKWVVVEPIHGVWGALESFVDATPPTIEDVDDVTYELGTSYFEVQWNVSDDRPSRLLLYRDSDLELNQTWYGGDVSIDVGGYGLGETNWTLVVIDRGGLSASDSVFVFVVDTMAPSIEGPDDFSYEIGANATDITWVCFDFDPFRRMLYLDEALRINETWTGTDMTVSTADLWLGRHNYTLVIVDSTGHRGRDVVLVNVVDTTPPEVIGPADFSIELGTIAPNITWSCYDLDPFAYLLYVDDSVTVNETWSGANVTVGTAGLSLGEHNYTLIVLDSTGNLGRDVLSVSVVDTTDPVLVPLAYIQYEYGTSGNNLVWEVTDAAPLAYVVYLGTEVYQSGAWDGSSIVVDVDNLPLGAHVFTIWVYDSSDNNDTDSAMVIVEDTTDPLLQGPEDTTFISGTTGNVVRWNASDYLPGSYRLYVDDELVVEDDWDGSNIEFSADSLTVGIHNLTVVVIDTSGNIAVDTVYVAVEASTLPQTLMVVALGGLVVVAVLAMVCRARRT